MKRDSLFLALLVFAACGDDTPTRGDGGDVGTARPDMGFRCAAEGDRACDGNTNLVCVRDGEFLSVQREDCTAREPAEICLPDLGCALCSPNSTTCRDNNVVACNAAGDAFTVQEECDLQSGFVCRSGRCLNLCDAAVEDRSYLGCEFYGADLDNAALGGGRDASSQQYAIVVSNPSQLQADVVIEVNDAPYGETPVPREIESARLAPGDLEVFALPRREVDGSSSNAQCTPDGSACPGSEVCVCSGGDAPPCFCRVSEGASGLNDGTHSALSSQAYRVRASVPIIAYQFNPLDNVGVFSNDASILLPTSGIGRNYTVVGWPQTIADADCEPSEPGCIDIDFDIGRDDEDLRAFLTVLGTAEGTNVEVELGSMATRVWRPGTAQLLDPAVPFEVTLGPFDVLNLETDGLNQDFTGTQISASSSVTVFVGGEASDAPRFDTYATRQCCADHLEDQLMSNATLGSSFMVARMSPRTVALNNAFRDPIRDSVAEVNEPEWVRVQAISELGPTTVTTTLLPPDDRFTLSPGESRILRVEQDFLMSALDNRAIAVLQVLPSQQVIGIPNVYPGGDPAIIVLPPREQYRQDYVFLTPDRYAFDFLTITAPANASIVLDGEELDGRRCEISPADGIVRMPGDPPANEVVYRCQLSFPDIANCDPDAEGCIGGVLDGDQNDGVHTLVSNEPVGVVVYGFDSFVSYAYAAGLNLTPIPR